MLTHMKALKLNGVITMQDLKDLTDIVSEINILKFLQSPKHK